MSLIEIHARLGNTVLLYFLAVSLWGFYRFFRKQGVNSSYWGMLAIAELLVIAQGVLGGYLWLVGLRPGRAVHILYGIFVPILIPGAYAYTKGREGRAEMLVYGTATIIAVGGLMRALFTGAPLPGG